MFFFYYIDKNYRSESKAHTFNRYKALAAQRLEFLKYLLFDILFKTIIAFDEGERKPNSVLRPVSFELVCLCTVMRNESSRNARADVWATNWPPRLIFAGASIGRETGATIF